MSETLCILDGRWIGHVRGFESGPPDATLVLNGAMEIVSAILGMQAPQGMVQVRQCTVYPLALTNGPKDLPVKWSTLLWVSRLDDEEQKQIKRAYDNALESVKTNQARARSGLVL